MRSKRTGGRAGLTLRGYFDLASKSDRFKDQRDNFKYYVFGLFGEVGGLLAAFKKERRDAIGLSQTEREFVSEEIGDALWYLMHAADRAGIHPDQLGMATLQWLKETHQATLSRRRSVIDFAELDRAAASIRPKGKKKDSALLRQLASHCGTLVGRSRDEVTPDVVIQHFGAMLGLLAAATHGWGLSTGEIALENLAKIRDRWPGKNPKYIDLFDDKFEPHEQLPRKRFTVEYVERKRGDMAYVAQSIQGIAIGDPLTDNNHQDDGYRYHDVFHLSYAVHLGWSPVIRALLKRKRKSNSRIDTNEDGARANIIEEGIATWIFNYADYNKFAQINEGDLDFSLLKQVRKIVRSYEAEKCPLWQWERAILNGMHVFKALYENRGGLVTVDIPRRKMTYSTNKRKA